MARKKKSPSDKKTASKSSQRKSRRPAHREDEGDLLDALLPLGKLPLEMRRQLMASLVGEEMAEALMSPVAEDKLAEASQVDSTTEPPFDRAFDAKTPQERRRHLQELVEHDPDCVEGWIQLADSHERTDEAIPFLQQAVAAAERALPEHLRSGELDRHDEGVRTYIWALRDLMDALKSANRLDEAIAIGQQILHREPEDHTAARYELLGLLLEIEKQAEVQDLLQAYDRDLAAAWTFGRLLLAIQNRAGEDELAPLLQQAHKNNPHVVDYLLDRRPAPAEMPGLVELKGDSGAVHCVIHLRKAWASTPGAISWLREAAGKAGLLQPVPTEDLSNTELADLFGVFDNQKLHDLPPHPAPVWIAGTYEMPPVHRPGRKRPKKVWALYALAASGPVNLEILEQRPNADDLWEFLLQTMRQGEVPGRPERIEFPQKGLCRQLRIEASRTGVTIDVCKDPPPLELMFETMAKHLDWEGRSDVVSDEDVLALPQDPTDVWQCDLIDLQERLVDERGELRRATAMMVISERDELVLAQNISVEAPDDQTLLGVLRQAMMVPMAGDPRRPAAVAVRHADDRLLLLPTLDRWNVSVRVDPDLETFDRLRQGFSDVLNGDPSDSLHADPEITREDRAAFYESACRFYGDRPWQRWFEDDVVRIECEAIGSAPIYALVMGQSGIETGLSLFDDRTIPERLFQGDEAAAMRDLAGFSLNFEEEQSVPVPDLNDIEQFGWPIATPEAYPVPIRINKGPSYSPITRAQLQMLTALMDAIAALPPRSPEPVTAQSGDVSVTCHYDGRAR